MSPQNHSQVFASSSDFDVKAPGSTSILFIPSFSFPFFPSLIILFLDSLIPHLSFPLFSSSSPPNIHHVHLHCILTSPPPYFTAAPSPSTPGSNTNSTNSTASGSASSAAVSSTGSATATKRPPPAETNGALSSLGGVKGVWGVIVACGVASVGVMF